MKGLAVDLVILNEKPPSYLQDLQAALEGLVRAGRPTLGATPEGSIVVLRAELLSAAELDCLAAAARVMLPSRLGTLAEQVGRAERAAAPVPRRRPPQTASRTSSRHRRGARFDLGGFVGDGREY